ncbi:LysR family transcriptional regulator [Snodgrassella sp. CFCC 13594]|uniref:LysR family transcriptional regulator n=1 Tax=Snodgrassella sp. CFCC 13594 TaxID=1775559 RepID=UPI000837721C|nr:LysR family transcriptional regulator [Snodgrassella sp. CFCC 13594]
MTEIKSLLAFAAVMEHGSMIKAAQILGMTPSAVSQHISSLEQKRGVKLFQRSTRRISPTDAGRLLGVYCSRLLKNLNDAENALENIRTEAAGPLKITAPSAMVHAPAFRQALRDLSQNYPHITPNLVMTDSMLDLTQSDVDIAIRGGNCLNTPNMVVRPLTTWHMQVYAAPWYLSTVQAAQHPQDLHAYCWLSTHSVQRQFTRDHDHYMLRIEDFWTCQEMGAIATMTLAGLGVSFQLDGEMAEHVEAGRLVPLLPEWQILSIPVYIVTPYRIQSAKVAAAVHLFQAAFARQANHEIYP